MKILLSTSPLLARYVHPSSGAIFAGLDIGSRVVGVAVSDRQRYFIDPLPNILRKGPNTMAPLEIARFSRELNKVVVKHGVNIIVVGLPIHDDKLSPFCREIVQLVRSLDCAENTVCTFWDESYTSAAAASICGLQSTSKIKFLKDKDGLSAVVLLKNFFRAHKNGYES
jgi:putative Holliday junction resolvase